MTANYIKTIVCASALVGTSLNNKINAQTFPPNGSCETVLNFDGVNEYVNIPTSNNIPIGNSNYTLEAWFYANAMSNNVGSECGIIGWGNYGASNEVNALRLNSAGGIYNYWWANDIYANTGNISGAWHHVAATFDGTTRKLYLDGNLLNSDNPGSGHAVPNTTNFSIGITAPFLNEYFNGRLDEIRVWNIARTQAEIQAAMNTQLSGNESGLVAYWRMNETSGSSLNSSTATANTGTLINMEISDWKLYDGADACGSLTKLPPNSSCGTVLDFDGSNDYVSMNFHHLQTNYTEEVWFKTSNPNGGILETNGGGNDKSIYLSGGNLNHYVWSYEIISTSGTNYADDQWHHVAIVLENGVGQKMYVDGVLAASGSKGYSDFYWSSLFYLGYSSNVGFFQGQLDEVKIWNAVRSPNQIIADMNAEATGNETGLWAYWNFNEKFGSNAYDATSNNYTGTLNNMQPTMDWKQPNGSNPCTLTPPNTSCETVLEFDGVNEFITSSAPLKASSGTWEAWIQKNDWSQSGHNDDRLFGNGINFTANNSFYFSLHNTVGLHFRYGGSPDGGNTYISSLLTQSLLPSSWHHLAATWDNNGSITTINIYIDGTLVGSTTTSLLISNSPVTFVAGDPVNPKFGGGKMDEVRLWNVARTQNQIRASMSSELNGNEAGLVYYWDMNEGTNSLYSLDKTSNGYNGTLRNMEPSSDWKSASGGTAGNKLYSQTLVIPANTTTFIGGANRSTSGTYYETHTSASGCDSLREVILKVLDTYSLSSSPSAVCATSGTSTLTLAGSQTGFNYYFRNDLNDTIISSIMGTGSSLAVNTGTVTTTTIYNVNAANASGGLSFDGVNNHYLDRGAVLTSQTTNVALEAWFKWAGTTGGNQWILLNGSGCCDGYGIYLDPAGFIYGQLSGVVGFSSNTSAVVGQWTHVALTRGAGQWNLYVNGVSKATNASGPNTPSTNFTIGADNNLGSVFNGVIDEVRVWTINRTAADIRYNMYNCFVGQETGLRANYKFEDGSNSSYAKDASQYGSYLTLHNMNISSVWVSGSDACSASSYEMPQTSTFFINPVVPTISINPAQTTICSGTSTNLVASGANSYVWQPGSLSGSTVSVSPSLSQTYSVTGTNACGTDVKITVVNVIPSPTALISGSIPPLCSGSSTISASGGISYIWSNGSIAPSITPNIDGIITVTTTAANGCTDKEAIEVNPTPIADISGNKAICGEGHTSLTAYGYGATNFAWSTGAVTQAITVSTGGIITLTVSSAVGCSSSKSANITESTIPDILFTLPSSLNTLCSSLSSVILSGGLPVGGTYSGTGVTGTQFFSPAAVGEGDYVITYMVSNGYCSNKDSATIQVKFCPIPVGIDQLTFEENIEIYPNPAVSNITVQMISSGSTNTTLKLMSMQGSEVYAETYIQQQGVNTKTIDLTKQSKGVYWLQLKTEYGTVVKKVVLE